MRDLYQLTDSQYSFKKIFYPEYTNQVKQFSNKDKTEFESEYVNTVVKTDQKKMNLVFIYAESLERTYFNEDLFPGLVQDLKSINKTYDFTNINKLWATGWTIAGMFGSQCGLPLALGYNEMAGATSTFYEQAFCIGDQLRASNYHLSFIQGTSVVFSGIQNIYKSHGFHDILGKKDLIPKLKDKKYINHWGLYDDSVLPFAKSLIKNNQNKLDQQATFIATMDTHHPNGHMSKSCAGQLYQDGKNPILNSVFCSQKLIANFIKNLNSTPLGKNTLIVVLSDHLAMRNSATHILEKGDRKNLFFIIDPRKSTQETIKRKGSILDVGATVSHLMGFGKAIGLGRSLLNSQQQTLSEKYDSFETKLKEWSREISTLWGMPKLHPGQKLTFHNNTLSVNSAFFKLPLLITVQDDNNVSPHFGIRIYKQLNRVNPLTPILWVDRCNKITKIFSVNKIKSKFCYAAGRLNVKMVIKAVNNTSILQSDTLFPPINENNISFSTERFKSLLPKNKKKKLIRKRAQDRSRFIAHAGGMFKGMTYTNSLEALNHNYQNGFKFFELDISKTSDDIFVAAHDWKSWRNKTGHKKNSSFIPTLSQFNKVPKSNKTSSLSIHQINDWFTKHKDATLVTDKVNTPLLFSKQFKYKKRLIMELFSEKAVKEALSIGVTPMPSWLHVIKKLKSDPLDYFKDNKISHMSMPIGEVRKNKDLLKTLAKNNIKIFLYHINYVKHEDETFVTCQMMDIVHGLYADKWTFPKNLKCPKGKI